MSGAGRFLKKGLLEIDGLPIDGMFYINGLERQTAASQFRSIERLEVFIVEHRVALGQDKGFVNLALMVDMAEIGFPVESIVALGGKN